MNPEDLEFITNLDKILSFVDLQKIFETWERDGSIANKKNLLQLGYVSLISHPAIFLTKENACDEINAANVCHDLWVKYDKEGINKKINGDDEKLSTATKLTVLPPYMYLLYRIDNFYLLHYLLIGMFDGKSDNELSLFEGDLFAKSWLSLLDNGYKGEVTEKAYMDDLNHRVLSRRIILKLKLSDKYVKEMDDESIKPKWEKYLNLDNSGSGCMITLLMALGTLSTMAMCIGLFFCIF